jgi:hypothetical protein
MNTILLKIQIPFGYRKVFLKNNKEGQLPYIPPSPTIKEVYPLLVSGFFIIRRMAGFRKIANRVAH